MKKTIACLILICASVPAFAQNLTPAQKEADFRYLAGLFSTYYAPLDWKKQLFGFDAMNIQPWLDQVAQTKTDLDFYEICVAYVASLNDTHDAFSLTSDFSTRLGFTVDVYDGVLLIDSINRTLLPTAQFPFAIGDELVSMDGTDAQTLLKNFAKYGTQGNPISTKRMTAARLLTRSQSNQPHATDTIGQSSTVVIRRQSGTLETYKIAWTTSGTPMQVGPVPSPKNPNALSAATANEPDYMAALREAQWSGVLDTDQTGVLGYGGQTPAFLGSLPGFNFTRRLGATSADFFYSGTFPYEELTIGYIRIPNYQPTVISSTTALQNFEKEIAFMNANTDGLIIDDMHNTGGLLCFGEEIAARLIPYQFRATGFELRPYWNRILGFYNSLNNARLQGAPEQIIDQYDLLFNAMMTANRQGRTTTDPLPLCTSSLTRDPILDSNGNPIAYQKPLMILIDEFSTSTADSVPGMVKDAGRAVFFGMRTNGAGGNNTSFNAGAYSESNTGMTLALQARKSKIGVSGYPSTELIENVGVWPDITNDYMTKANLLQSGAPFVSSFLQHMAAEIRAKR